MEMMNIIKEYGGIWIDNPEYLDHIYQNGFIFNEFTLIWEGMYTYKVYISGVKEEQSFHVKKLVRQNGITVKTTKFDFTLMEYLYNHADFFKYVRGKKFSEYTREMLEESWSADYLPVIAFMQYVIYKALNKEVVYKKQTTRKYKSSGKAKKQPENKEYKLVDVITYYESHLNHGKHVITCPGWPVKGHPRHCASGKVTWVHPYPKGKDRDKLLKDRDYKL